MAIIDIVDSYHEHVRSKMAVVDAGQGFGGIINAREWPLTPPIEGFLYLLFIEATPTDAGSEAQNFYEILCQWNWLIIGTDIAASQRAENRGDRYRRSMRIINNLRQASYPSHTRKNSHTPDPNTGTLTATPVSSEFPRSAEEWIWWSRLRMAPRQDEASGLVYGAASVRIYGYDSVLAAVA